MFAIISMSFSELFTDCYVTSSHSHSHIVIKVYYTDWNYNSFVHLYISKYLLSFFHSVFIIKINFSLLSKFVNISDFPFILLYNDCLKISYSLQMETKWCSFSISLELQIIHVLFSTFVSLNLRVSTCRGKVPDLICANYDLSCLGLQLFINITNEAVLPVIDDSCRAVISFGETII